MIRIASLNIRGINKKEKMNFLNDFLIGERIKICFLQETHFDSQDVACEFEEICNSFLISYTINETSKSKGVAILISKNLKGLKIINKFFFESRVLNLEIEFENEKINLLNIYAPNIEQEQFEFINQLYNLIIGKKRVIMGGDFNSVVRANDRMGGSVEKVLKKSDKEWAKLYGQLGFKEIIWKKKLTVEDLLDSIRCGKNL